MKFDQITGANTGWYLALLWGAVPEISLVLKREEDLVGNVGQGWGEWVNGKDL